jgi:hypothetical protein
MRRLRQPEFQRHRLAHGPRDAMERQTDLGLDLDIRDLQHGLAEPAHHDHANLGQFRQHAAVPLAHVALDEHEQNKNTK